jgi:molybdopterin synthase catalytic subunit
MQVRVRLFARARDLARADAVVLDLPGGATAGDLRRRLAEAHPALGGLLERSALAVNNEFAEDGLTLPHHAEVALLPPVSGGQRTEGP